METEAVYSAVCEGGRVWRGGWGSTSFELHFFAVLTPVNGITCPHTEVGMASRIKFVAELELLALSTVHLHKITFTLDTGNAMVT